MDFYAVLDQVVDLLRQRGRVTYRALKIQFKLDDDQLEALKDELLYAHPPAADDAGRGLLWTEALEVTPAPVTAPAPAQDRTPLAYTPPYLAEKMTLAISGRRAGSISIPSWRTRSMPEPGDVVTVDFVGATGVKRRPVVVVSSHLYHAHRPDLILAVLTTQVTTAITPTDYVLQDWAAAGLHRPSAFRAYLGMATTAAVHVIGRLSARAWGSVQVCLMRALAMPEVSIPSYGKATLYFPVLDLLKRYAQVDDHDFALSHDDTSIISTTPTGRATVQALRMNDDLIVTARECWVKGGWWPPADSRKRRDDGLLYRARSGPDTPPSARPRLVPGAQAPISAGR